jgi:hypothetical protein
LVDGLRALSSPPSLGDPKEIEMELWIDRNSTGEWEKVTEADDTRGWLDRRSAERRLLLAA